MALTSFDITLRKLNQPARALRLAQGDAKGDNFSWKPPYW